ncbi:hypothetical protein [Terricaulis sp.]|uniref:hypothetical protein n=1 Tax=Terricaulis sp. TaxID=2768686 RepID=UPI0037837564
MSFDPTNIDHVIRDMYAMISGPAGPRDWARQAELFHPTARMMRTGVDEAGVAWIKIMSLDEYRANVTPFFDAQGFFEIEKARRLDVFGNMAHAWSVYEAFTAETDTTPERRGINSIQLMRDEHGHWRIISMIWDNERPGLQIQSFQTREA